MAVKINLAQAFTKRPGMNASKLCREQYEFVRDSRKVLFDYCKTISGEHFLTGHSSFGRGGSIRNLLVHIANTYDFWIGSQYLKKEIVFTEYESRTGINEVILLFDEIDIIMQEFFTTMNEDEKAMIDYEINDGRNSVPAVKLFSHVITHEFHHKGQILAISRHLGYTPVDTDIMR